MFSMWRMPTGPLSAFSGRKVVVLFSECLKPFDFIFWCLPMAFKSQPSLFSVSLHLSKSLIKPMPPPVGTWADSNQLKPCPHSGGLTLACSWVTITNPCLLPFPVLWSSSSDQLGSLPWPQKVDYMNNKPFQNSLMCVRNVSLCISATCCVGVHPVSAEWLQCWPSRPLAVSQSLSESLLQKPWSVLHTVILGSRLYKTISLLCHFFSH